MSRTEQVNPVAQRAIARRARWEAERQAKIWAQVERGEITEEEAKLKLEAEMKTIELFIAMNEDAGWVVCSEESEALAKLAEDEGGYPARIVKLSVKMSPPIMTEAIVEVPDEAGQKVEVQTA
jgi:hypothetical protein